MVLFLHFAKALQIPDDDNTYRHPEDVGNFNLFETSAFEKMPSSLHVMGGLFFPIYQREALSLVFSCAKLSSSERSNSSSNDSRFAMKIYAGGINAVSGAVVGGEDQLEQDYVVIPLQMQLRGLSTCLEEAKQFVSMPLGSGYIIEHQLTEKDNIGGFFFFV